MNRRLQDGDKLCCMQNSHRQDGSYNVLKFLKDDQRLLTSGSLSPLPPLPPADQLWALTVLACPPPPPCGRTPWSTARSRWSCAATARTAGSRRRSPARCSTTPAACAPTTRTTCAGRCVIRLFLQRLTILDQTLLLSIIGIMSTIYLGINTFVYSFDLHIAHCVLEFHRCQ